MRKQYIIPISEIVELGSYAILQSSVDFDVVTDPDDYNPDDVQVLAPKFDGLWSDDDE